MRKDYDHLAKCLVPIGEQRNMTRGEVVAMLRRKTRRFSEGDVGRAWGKG